jgi:hypothetical protein
MMISNTTGKYFSLFRRSKVTKLTVSSIILCLSSFHHLRRRRLTVSFESTLTGSLLKGSIVTWASHIFVTKNAGQVRKIPAVWEVKATFYYLCKILIISSLTVFIATFCRTVVAFVSLSFLFWNHSPLIDIFFQSKSDWQNFVL